MNLSLVFNFINKLSLAIADVYNKVRFGIIRDNFSLVIFIIIGFIFFIDMLIYFIIHYNLWSLNRKLKKRRDWEEPLYDLINRYRKMVEMSGHQVNTRVYVESFFSSLKAGLPFLPFGFPLIGTIKLIQNTVSVFILVGVLGTFIGIYKALVEVFYSSSDITKILSDIDSLTPLLQGMGTAFATSIVGMSAALLTTIFLKVFNAEQFVAGIMTRLENVLENEVVSHNKSFLARSFQRLEKVLNSGFKKTHLTMENIYQNVKGLDNFTHQVEEAAVHMEDFNQDLNESMSNLKEFYRINKDFTEGYIENIQGLNENFAGLFGSLKEISLQQSQLKDFIQDINQNQQKLVTTISKTVDKLDRAQNQIGSQVKVLTEIKGGQDDYLKSVSQLNNNLQAKFGGMLTTYQKIDQTNQDIANQLKDIGPALTRMEKNQQQFTHNIKDYDQLIRELTTAHQALNQGVNSLRRSLIEDLTRNLDDLNDTLHRIEDEYDQSLNKNVRQFSEHMGRVNNVIEHKYDRLIENMDVMKDKMVNYLHAVSFNAGGIEESIKEMNTAVKSLHKSLEKFNNTAVKSFSQLEKKNNKK